MLEAALSALEQELLAVLCEVEWAGLEDHPAGGYYGACPRCGGGDPDNPATPAGWEGHVDGCELDAALTRARGRPS